MAKVTFEFDDNEESYEIEKVINRNKFIVALEELSDLYRRMYNGKIYDENATIYVLKEGRVATEKDYEEARLKGTYLEGGKTYYNSDWIENELNIILDDIRPYLD